MPQRRRDSRAPCDAPRLNVALARLVVSSTSRRRCWRRRARAALTGRACGSRNWHGRCSRDQLRRRMGQHGAALGRVVEAAGARSSERDPNPRAPLTLTLTLTWNLTPDPDYGPDP